MPLDQSSNPGRLMPLAKPSNLGPSDNLKLSVITIWDFLSGIFSRNFVSFKI